LLFPPPTCRRRRSTRSSTTPAMKAPSALRRQSDAATGRDGHSRWHRESTDNSWSRMLFCEKAYASRRLETPRRLRRDDRLLLAQLLATGNQQLPRVGDHREDADQRLVAIKPAAGIVVDRRLLDLRQTVLEIRHKLERQLGRRLIRLAALEQSFDSI